MRVVSLLPSATEIVCALGMESALVGVSHECDHPPEVVAKLPKVTQSAIPHGLSSAEIDVEVARLLREGKSLYTLDGSLLEALAPDIVLTQEVCDVCAVDYEQACSVSAQLRRPPRVLSLNAGSVEGILADICMVAEALGVGEKGQELVSNLRRRLGYVRQKVTWAPYQPRVYCMEWLDPPFAAGHWVPEMVAIAGGQEVLGVPHRPSFRVTWAQVIAAQPDVILLIPCGYSKEHAWEEWVRIPKPENVQLIPAVRDSRVYAIEANSYFSRPGPRVVEGVEQVARLLHPDLLQ